MTRDDRPAEAGYALIETLAAGALLLAVLAPATALLARVALDPGNERHLQALMLGRTAMEEALLSGDFGRSGAWTNRARLEASPGASTAGTTPDQRTGPWRSERQVRREGRRVWIRVRVHHRAYSRPLVALSTMRLAGVEARTGSP